MPVYLTVALLVATGLCCLESANDLHTLLTLAHHSRWRPPAAHNSPPVSLRPTPHSVDLRLVTARVVGVLRLYSFGVLPVLVVGQGWGVTAMSRMRWV
jgi:hypothetical protein